MLGSDQKVLEEKKLSQFNIHYEEDYLADGTYTLSILCGALTCIVFLMDEDEALSLRRASGRGVPSLNEASSQHTSHTFFLTVPDMNIRSLK